MSRPPSTSRPDRVEPVLERGHDAEVAAAAAHGPEQVRIVRRRWRCAAARRRSRCRPTAGCRRSARSVRISQPMPPPSVSPAMPVVETTPPVVARPNACVSRSNSPQVRPASARARAPRRDRRGCPSSRDRSIIRPPSQTPLPAALWPPPRTDSSSSCSRAKLTAADDVGGAGAARDQRRARGRSCRSRPCAPARSPRARGASPRPATCSPEPQPRRLPGRSCQFLLPADRPSPASLAP